MSKVGKIRPQQLKTARKILSQLPVKDEHCSREEAAALLEKDFKRAFKKGYTPKELCALFKKEGIIIPAPLVARYMETEDEDEKKENNVEEKTDSNTADKGIAAHEKTASSVTQNSEADSEETALTKSQSPVRHGKFKITPDTPIGEL